MTARHINIGTPIAKVNGLNPANWMPTRYTIAVHGTLIIPVITQSMQKATQRRTNPGSVTMPSSISRRGSARLASAATA